MRLWKEEEEEESEVYKIKVKKKTEASFNTLVRFFRIFSARSKLVAMSFLANGD